CFRLYFSERVSSLWARPRWSRSRLPPCDHAVASPCACTSARRGPSRARQDERCSAGGPGGAGLEATMPTLKGKTLFITGGSRGIGLAIGLRAAQDGANVVIAAKTSEPHPKLPGTIHTAAAEIEAAGGKALACVVDVRSEDQIRAAVDKAVQTFG